MCYRSVGHPKGFTKYNGFTQFMERIRDAKDGWYVLRGLEEEPYRKLAVRKGLIQTGTEVYEGNERKVARITSKGLVWVENRRK